MASDEQVIDMVAMEWVLMGGDTLGFEFLWMRIRDRITEIIIERDDDVG